MEPAKGEPPMSDSNRSLASLTWLSDREEVGGRSTSRVSLPGALSVDSLVRGMSEFSDISSLDWLLPSIKEVLGSDSRSAGTRVYLNWCRGDGGVLRDLIPGGR